ncbi:hypothetical protein [Streptomyces antimycoticus]|uniref:hypothetical protein n=1 Tax=Streptomyces antimycoticus TaxID=68175 RepID=UPI00117D3DB3|nr:hypothetical protein [Streptomyces antimycoticus]
METTSPKAQLAPEQIRRAAVVSPVRIVVRTGAVHDEWNSPATGAHPARFTPAPARTMLCAPSRRCASWCGLRTTPRTASLSVKGLRAGRAGRVLPLMRSIVHA